MSSPRFGLYCDPRYRPLDSLRSRPLWWPFKSHVGEMLPHHDRWLAYMGNIRLPTCVAMLYASHPYKGARCDDPQPHKLRLRSILLWESACGLARVRFGQFWSRETKQLMENTQQLTFYSSPSCLWGSLPPQMPRILRNAARG